MTDHAINHLTAVVFRHIEPEKDDYSTEPESCSSEDARASRKRTCNLILLLLAATVSIALIGTVSVVVASNGAEKKTNDVDSSPPTDFDAGIWNDTPQPISPSNKPCDEESILGCIPSNTEHEPVIPPSMPPASESEPEAEPALSAPMTPAPESATEAAPLVLPSMALTNDPVTSPTMPPTPLPLMGALVSPSMSPTLKYEVANDPVTPPTVSPTLLPSTPPTPKHEVANDPVTSPTMPPTSFLSEVAPEVASPLPTSEYVSYRPGNLTTEMAGLLLSEGLGARLIAVTNYSVQYANGEDSDEVFHIFPDGADTFEDVRPENEGGWIYVSNSESIEKRKGGVGAITFDKNGNILDYKMILKGTTMNCGGGRTPWNTWVSCEEVEDRGKIYQVDPTGAKSSEKLTLGSDGGRWESFAYDIRDRSQPRFFVTEDRTKGALRRFTPTDPNWDDPWSILHGEGTVDFLLLSRTHEGGGTFEWTNDLEAAKNSAREFYSQTEGVDAYGSQLFFVCKRLRQLFTVNLDDGTYTNQTTINGLMDGKPDQIERILNDPNDVLYFTEESGQSGIHARDSSGRYYTILESMDFRGETTGLAFSPDGRHMYMAYQKIGKVFDVYRMDGLPFNGKRLDVKYHVIDDLII